MQLVQRRIGLLFACFLVLLVAAGARASWLGIVEGHKLKRAAVVQQRALVVVPAQRGTIVDRKGVELAVSQPATTITATPYLIRNPQRVAGQLAQVLNEDPAKLLVALTRHSGFSYVARHVRAEQSDAIAKLKIAGLEFIPEFARVYPQAWMASQVLGAVGTDGNGLSGLEYSLDRVLHGKDGRRSLVKDALGRPIAMRDRKTARAGTGVRLTIDAAIQDRTENVLAGIGRQWHPKGATAIVMDPRNGTIYALANWPRINANNPAGAPITALQNRAIGGTYEPGSTFKAITVAGALEDGKVSPETTFNLAPTIHLGERDIGESHARGWVTLTTAEILKQSSNVGAITIGLREGADRFDYWVRRFGFGKPTGVDLPGEEGGIVPRRSTYSGSSMGNLPIGQGIAVTPMQMAAAYAAIANGGILRSPHIIADIGGRKKSPPSGHRIISALTAAQLRQMLEGVLGPGGTASGAAIPGYVLGGKTGTAEKPDPRTGGYSKDKYVASFVGFAPAQNPKLLAIIAVDEPAGGIHLGGIIAAPPWRQIVSYALNYLKIGPN